VVVRLVCTFNSVYLGKFLFALLLVVETRARDELGPVETLDLEVSPGPVWRVLYAPRWSPW
jgi:hypothetical protein